MKRNEMIKVYQTLSTLKNVTMSPIAANAILKNIKLLIEESKEIEEIRKELPKEYELKRNATLLKHAEKEEDGNPKWKIPNKEYLYLEENLEALSNELEELEKEHEDDIQKLKDFNDYMNEEITDINFKKVDIKRLPDLTPADLEVLEFMVR